MSIKNKIQSDDLLIIDVINIISLNKLIDGGAAIFQMENINHHSAKTGENVNKPLVKYILRV